MNFHERIIGFLTHQELDDLRVIEKIPVGTELYRFKLEQMKEVSTTSCLLYTSPSPRD